WTDTLVVLPVGGGALRPAPGPMRWAAPGGLRSLVEDLAADLGVTTSSEVERVDAGPLGLGVDGERAAAVVLAMPQPQACALLPTPLIMRLGLEAGLDWVASVTVWAGWRHRWGPARDGACVEGAGARGGQARRSGPAIRRELAHRLG